MRWEQRAWKAYQEQGNEPTYQTWIASAKHRNAIAASPRAMAGYPWTWYALLVGMFCGAVLGVLDLFR